MGKVKYIFRSCMCFNYTGNLPTFGNFGWQLVDNYDSPIEDLVR